MQLVAKYGTVGSQLDTVLLIHKVRKVTKNQLRSTGTFRLGTDDFPGAFVTADGLAAADAAPTWRPPLKSAGPPPLGLRGMAAAFRRPRSAKPSSTPSSLNSETPGDGADFWLDRSSSSSSSNLPPPPKDISPIKVAEPGCLSRMHAAQTQLGHLFSLGVLFISAPE